MYKSIKFLRVIDAPAMNLKFSHFFRKNPYYVTKRKIRDTIMEMKHIVGRRIRK